MTLKMTAIKKMVPPPQVEDVVSLRRHIHRSMAGWRDNRPMYNVHASLLTTESADRLFCPRAYAHWDLAKPEKHQEWLSTAMSLTFEFGYAVEDIVRGHIGAELVGHWECVHCKHVQKFRRQPIKCPDCGCKTMKYKEVRFESAISGVSCGVDALFDEGTGKLRIVESKSMDKEALKALTAPLAEHRLRTNYYLRLIAESDSPYKDQVHTDWGWVLYTSKGGYGFADQEVKTWGFPDDAFSPFKEFRIERKDAATEAFNQKGMMVKTWREAYQAWKDSTGPASGSPPQLPDRICKTSMDLRARKCSCVKACFNQGG